MTADLFRRRALAWLEHHHCFQALREDVVGHSDHRRPQHFRMQVQLVLDLDAVDVLAASHDHVLLAVEQPEVAVLVDLGPVTGQNKAVSPEDLGGLARLLPVSRVCLLTAVRNFTDDIGFDDFVPESSKIAMSVFGVARPQLVILRIASSVGSAKPTAVLSETEPAFTMAIGANSLLSWLINVSDDACPPKRIFLSVEQSWFRNSG